MVVNLAKPPILDFESAGEAYFVICCETRLATIKLSYEQMILNSVNCRRSLINNYFLTKYFTYSYISNKSQIVVFPAVLDITAVVRNVWLGR